MSWADASVPNTLAFVPKSQSAALDTHELFQDTVCYAIWHGFHHVEFLEGDRLKALKRKHRKSQEGAGEDAFVKIVLSSAGQRRPPQVRENNVREMVSMKKELIVLLPTSVACEIPYINDLLNNANTTTNNNNSNSTTTTATNDADEHGVQQDTTSTADTTTTTTTTNAAASKTKVVRLTFSPTSALTPEAIVACLEHACSSISAATAPNSEETPHTKAPFPIDAHNQFQFLAAASLLRVRSAMDICLQFVATHLTPATVVFAARFATKLSSSLLMVACYYHTKSLLLRPPATSVVTKALGGVSAPKLDLLGSKKKKAEQQKQQEEQQKQKQQEGQNKHNEAEFLSDGTVKCGPHSFPLSVFNDLATRDRNRMLRSNVANFAYDLYYVDEINLSPTAPFPRMYRMCHDHNSEFVLAALQLDEFADFVILNSDKLSFSLDAPLHMHCSSPAFVGAVSSNFLGTEFHVFDSGVNPQCVGHIKKDAMPFPLRRELCHIVFDRNVMGSQPRALRARVPARLQAPDPPAKAVVGNEGNVVEVAPPQPTANDDGTVDIDLNANDNTQGQTTRHNGKHKHEDDVPVFDDLDPHHHVEFTNKPPFWSEENECWMLDFFGRVNLASAKNFQLVQNRGNGSDASTEEVFLLFGKLTEVRYSLDFRHPISPLQAFGIGLAGIARKLAVN